MQIEEKDPYQEWQFERFEGQLTLSKRPTIRITKHQTIILNAAFIAQVKIKEERYKDVYLHYSEKKKAIAFEFLKESSGNPGALKITPINKSNFSIAARSFFSFYGLHPTEWEGSYSPYHLQAGEDPADENSYLWMIQLKDRVLPQSPKTSKPKKGKRPHI